MELSAEGTDAREVLVVESDSTRFPFSWDQWIILGEEVKPTNLGTSGFAPPSEEDGVILAKNYDNRFQT